MNRFFAFLPALALVACIDGGDSDSDSGGEPDFFDGTPLIWSVSKACSGQGWTFDFITDGLAGGITLEMTEAQASTNPWEETHVLDINTHDLHWDGQGSPTGTTTNAEAAAMDPADDADDDGRPDWGSAGQNFTTQSFDDADGLVGSWDHWAPGFTKAATTGAVVSSGASQTSFFDCAVYNNGSTLSYKATMYNDANPPAAVDCVIWGRRSADEYAGDGCVCIDADGDCTDGDET